MKLTVIGCSGSYPGPDSPASCYLVEADGFRVLLDLGSGALGALARHVPLDGIDAALFSHLHADHCLDLCGYYVFRKHHPAGQLPRIPVYGPSGTADRMARAYDLPADPGMRREFDFRTFPQSSFDLGPFHVTADQVAHPGESYGMRLEHGGRTLTYSGDSGPCDPLVRLAKGADLLLCEASFHDGRDDEADLHLNGREAAEHANRAGVARLLITHLPPWNDPARTLSEASVFDGPVELARPGISYVL